MQAAGIGLPLLNYKSLAPGKAEAYPAQDAFKSMFQAHLASRGYSASSSSTRGVSRSISKAQLRQARSRTSRSPLFTNKAKVSNRQSADTSDQSTRKSDQTRSTKAAKSSSPSWKANLRSRTLRLAQGATKATAAVVPTITTEMPQALQGLVDFLNQQPGGVLQVPADRLPQVEAFLLQAGLPAAQVQNLLNSPRFQEQGLSATDLVSAWQQAVQDTIKQQNPATADLQAQLNSQQTAAPLNPLENLTSQSDFQRLWQDLSIPPEALGTLRLALQQLGVPPESLTDLNQQNYPQGIPLKQIWELIGQSAKTSDATSSAASATAAAASAKNNLSPDSPLLLNGDADLEKWRQLLVQAGMDPELAQTLVSVTTPTNQKELRTSLLQMAPPAAAPQSQEAPKPLYLPENLRGHQIPTLQQENVGQNKGGNSGNNGNSLGLNLGSPGKLQEVNLPNNLELNNFLTLLTGDASLNAQTGTLTGASGGTPAAVNALLTPEAREALWTQVQNGILGNLKPGENQVTLTLNPPEMGKLNLTLNVKDGMVQVSAITSHSAVAEAATAGVQQLAQALTQQGLTLTQFQFHHQDEAPGQSNLAFFQNSGDQRQTGDSSKEGSPDRWEQRTPQRQQRWAGGIDCFA